MTTATVLVPTHNHGPLLAYAVRSALAQTVSSLEVFIVGDGADDATRAAALDLVASDARVRFFDRPKGPRHGEATRHAVLQEATGTIVCYLSDDDLWLPHHVETLIAVLREADFAHAVPLFADAAGHIQAHPGDLDVPSVRARMLERFNFIPLSAAAHTLDLYRRLPNGWTPAPQGLPTDLHMWQQILRVEGCRAVSTTRATLINFPALQRQGWSIEQRIDELSRWSERLRSGSLEADLATAGLHRVMRTLVDAQESAQLAEESSRDAAAQAESTRARLEEERAALEGQIAVLRHDLTTAHERLSDRQRACEAERAASHQRTSELENELAMAAARMTSVNEAREIERTSFRQQIAGLERDLAAASTRASDAQDKARAIESTLTWRLRTSLVNWKPLATVWTRLRRPKPPTGS